MTQNFEHSRFYEVYVTCHSVFVLVSLFNGIREAVIFFLCIPVFLSWGNPGTAGLFFKIKIVYFFTQKSGFS